MLIHAPHTMRTVHSIILDKITNGSHLDLVKERPGTMVRRVDFGKASQARVNDAGNYRILLHANIPKAGGVACIFPNNSKSGQDVVLSQKHRSLSSFNHAINESLKGSVPETEHGGRLLLAVHYGNHVFRCENLSGTMYVVWAEHVTRTNEGNVSYTTHHNVPLLINMNGTMQTTNVFVLKEQVQDASDCLCIPITATSPRLYMHLKSNPFVCEQRLANKADCGLRTTTYAVAMAQSDLLTRNAFDAHTYNPYHASVDAETLPDGELQFEGAFLSNPLAENKSEDDSSVYVTTSGALTLGAYPALDIPPDPFSE